MRILFLAALALLATGCSSPDAAAPDGANVLLKSDFESLAGWVEGASPSLNRERAHSGQYSIKTDKDIEYSLTYRTLLGQFSPQRISKIRVSAWVFVTQPSDAQLTVQLLRSMEDNTSTFNQHINLTQAVKEPGEWQAVSQVFTLPAEASAANQLRIFVWRATAPGPVYLDDLVVTAEP